MRHPAWSGSSALMVLAILVGCHGSNGGSGPDARMARDDAAGSDTGSAVGGSADGKALSPDANPTPPGVVRDCFPECVRSLRARCERPAVDAGTCEKGASGGGVYCYSNGVRETRVDVDGGELATYTEYDGKTGCYQVFVESGTIMHFRTISGQEVAEVRLREDGVYNGIYTVTCDGVTQDVNLDPSCGTLSEANCASPTGGCR